MNYILSIGINDYRFCIGGVNKVILAHQDMFQKYGYDYMYIYAVSNRKYWKIIKNNKYVGVKTTSRLLKYLFELQQKGDICAEVHIHHLINLSLEELDKVINNLNCKLKFYIHDYYSICPSIKMLKNDLNFCGCEEMTETKCAGCKYYSDGIGKIREVRNLLKKYQERIRFIAPSDEAKEQWNRAYFNYKDKVDVIYHQVFEKKYTGNLDMIGNDEDIKIAYIGEPIYSKGWNTWENILKETDEHYYKYFYFGNSKKDMGNVKKINVDFRNRIDAMTIGLRSNQIDCVVLWSVCPETYSYTYYESLSANAFVITNSNSGNIARQVEKNGNGIVFENENELLDLLKEPENLKKIINSFKKNNIGGPLCLEENPEIVTSMDNRINNPVIKQSQSHSEFSEKLISLVFGVVEFIRMKKKRG